MLTLHWPATVDNPDVLQKLWQPSQKIAARIPLIFPVHPRTRKRLQEAGFDGLPAGRPKGDSKGIRMIPPLSYLWFLRLQSEATFSDYRLGRHPGRNHAGSPLPHHARERAHHGNRRHEYARRAEPPKNPGRGWHGSLGRGQAGPNREAMGWALCGAYCQNSL